VDNYKEEKINVKGQDERTEEVLEKCTLIISKSKFSFEKTLEE
jgi:hypothetical protein